MEAPLDKMGTSIKEYEKVLCKSSTFLPLASVGAVALRAEVPVDGDHVAVGGHLVRLAHLRVQLEVGDRAPRLRHRLRRDRARRRRRGLGSRPRRRRRHQGVRGPALVEEEKY